MVSFAKVTKQYGNRVLYRNGSFQINPGEKIGLVGPNGAGKTTLFRLIMGEENPDQGQITRPDKLRVAYFAQDIEDMRGKTVLNEVLSSVGPLEKVKKELLELESKLSQELSDSEMTKTLDRYGELQTQFEEMGGYELESKVKEILTGLGFFEEDFDRPTESFSGGWKMRIALAKVLASKPELLLMDEPTNHLDLESIEWLESWIRQFPGSVLMTSHDRDFMNRLVSRIVEVANQSIHLYGGNYDFYERERDIRKTQLLASAARQEEMLEKEKEFIARFQARASHAAQVQSRVKKIEKLDLIEIPPEEKEIAFTWPESPRGGDDVVRLEAVGKVWPPQTAQGKPKEVFLNASALIKRLDRIALVGVNGAGKSTLLKIMVGSTEATSGKVQVGPSILTGYFSQNSMDVLDPQKTVLEEMESRLPQTNIGILRNLLGAFKFSGDSVEKKVKVLSGGEKSRLVLATLLAKPLNFLVLDEPTNHLDIQSREVLLEALKTFQGTLIIVSHDRYFLRKIVNRVFRLDKKDLQVYDETWDEYSENFEASILVLYHCP